MNDFDPLGNRDAQDGAEDAQDAQDNWGTPEQVVTELAALDPGKRLDRIGELVAWLAGRGELELQRYKKAVTDGKLLGARDWTSLASEAKKRRAANLRAAVRSDCPYTTKNGCLYLKTPDGEPELLARFIPEVIAEVIRDDGAEITTVIGIRVTRPGGRAAEVEVLAEQLPKARLWAAQAIGAHAVITPMSRDEAHVATAAQYLGDGRWESRTTYAHTGWRTDIDGRWRFLTASGALGADGLDTSVCVDLGTDSLNLYALPDPATASPRALAEAVRASLALLDVAPLKVTAPMLGAAYRAPLPLLPETSAYVTGGSGSLKTAVSAVVLQHYGRGLDVRHLPANWTFTGNALESIAYQLANVLLIIDDYAPQNAEDPRRLAAAADRIFRGSANSAGRGRLRADSSRRPERPPRAQIAATGEDVPPGESLRARLTVAEVDAGAVDVGKLTEAQQHAADGAYELAMAGYVRYLAARLDADPDHTDRLRQDIADRRTELAGTLSGHARVPEATAGLLTGFRQFLAFAVAVDALSADKAKAQMEKVKAALVELAAEQVTHTKGMAVAEIYLRALRSALAGGHAHLADQETGREPAEAHKWGWEPYPSGDMGNVYHPKGTCIGWLSRSGDIYLHPDTAYEVALDRAQRSKEPLATHKATIHKRLKEGEHLAVVGEKRPTVTQRIAGKVTRVLHVRADRITGEVGV